MILEDRVPMGKLELLLDDRRMAKGWTSLGTTNAPTKMSRQERMKKDAAADKILRKTKVCKDAGELVKEAAAAYEKMQAEKAWKESKKTKSKAEKTAKA